MDGQGFSPEFLKKYKNAVTERKNRITLAAERRDFVNCLGLYTHGGTVFYSGYRADPAAGRPYGYALPYFHCPDALRARNGEAGAVSLTNPIPETISQLVAYFLTEPKYESARKQTAIGLVSIMMKEKKAPEDNIAGALVNLGIVFMELLCTSEPFRKKLESVFIKETGTMIATFEMIMYTEKDEARQPTVLSLAEEGMAQRLRGEKEIRKAFYGSLKYLASLMMRILMEPEVEKAILEYLFWFVGKLIKRLAGIRPGMKSALIPSAWNIFKNRTQTHAAMASSGQSGSYKDVDADFGLLLAHIDSCMAEEM
jgi:hypothetical protein